jgi:hypothetical protein
MTQYPVAQSRGKSVLGWATIIAALAFLNWWLLNVEIDRSPLEVSSAGRAVETKPAAGPPALPGAPSSAAVRTTLERPLFHPDRRPILAPREPTVDKVATRGAAPQPPGGVMLMGTVVSGPATRKALIRTAGLPVGVWLGLGERLEGWQLVSVEARSAVIEAQGARHEIELASQPPAQR